MTISEQLPFELDSFGISRTSAWDGIDARQFNLVLEGGSMRGLFTAGVLDYFMARGLAAEHAIGVSAGALNGLNYILGSFGRSVWINCRYCTDPRYLSMSSFLHTGNVFGRELSFEQIPQEFVPIDLEGVYDSPMRFTTVASDLETGAADYHTHVRGEGRRVISDYLCASSSMPFVSQLVEVDGKKLLDGGVCDSVPLQYSLATGQKKHVVVLTREDGYVKKPETIYRLANTVYSGYPRFVEAIQARADEYNETYALVKRMEDAGDIFVLRPQFPVEVSHTEHDPLKLVDLYAHGYEQAMLNYDKLISYLANA